MELKKYQKRVLDELEYFLKKYKELGTPEEAYRQTWLDKHSIDMLALDESRPYKRYNGIPFSACLKVPTGGGKTFIGLNSIRTVFKHLPAENNVRAVVWLVPSEAILTQTLNAFRNPLHPYRQKLNQISPSVSIFDKNQLLSAQGFNPVSVRSELTIMVLSYDSFRASNKDARKSMQENSQLAGFLTMDGENSTRVVGAADTSLTQVINKLHPLVIVDESHHAKTSLSIEMLADFNPRFVLELTATPKDGSNVVACAEAAELKAEHLIKLPVILYNMKDPTESVTTAISLQSRLEELAKKHATDVRPIRPIVLVQAQPKIEAKGKAAALTFDKVRQMLVKCGIPKEQIAIKVSGLNELENVDLMSPSCEIRYVVTVNALKEGWDCPFAYILLSLANKSSKVEVEQVLGRVLRQPFARKNPSAALNLAYVLTSSDNFQETIKSVIDGLQNAGFSRADYRAKNTVKEAVPEQPTPPPSTPELPTTNTPDAPVPPSVDGPGATEENDDDDIPIVRSEEVAAEIKNNTNTTAQALIEQGEKEAEQFEQLNPETVTSTGIPGELRNSMNVYRPRKEFRDEIKNLRLPRFGIEAQASAFDFDSETNLMELSNEHLLEDFKLSKYGTDLDLEKATAEIVSIDTHGREDGTVTARKIQNEQNLKLFQELLSSDSTEEKLRHTLVQYVDKQLDDIDFVPKKDILTYLKNVAQNLDSWGLQKQIDQLGTFVAVFKNHIRHLAKDYRLKQFDKQFQSGKLKPINNYVFPEKFETTAEWINHFDNSLYDGEEPGNKFENQLMFDLSGMSNIRWWHRNPFGVQGFYINGPVGKHYPDFILETQKGTIIMVETKGDQLKNSDDTIQKQHLGQTWANVAGSTNYRYFMVFLDSTQIGKMTGVLSYNEFMEILRNTD